MKCPKCNYVSHDYLDVCRKCGRDLAAFKQEIGLLVLQPGGLDLGLVLGGAGADDFFESVEEEVSMHVSDDDDFDISLDDYTDHPGARRSPAAAPRAGGRAPEDDLAGMDHLTLELDASSLSAELAAHLRAAQALPDPSPLQPAAPPPVVPGEIGLPGHVTLDMEPENLSTELSFGTLPGFSALPSAPPPSVPEAPAGQDVSRSLDLDLSGIDFTLTTPPAGTAEQFEMAEDLDEAGTERVDDAFTGTDVRTDDDSTPIAYISGAMPSLQLQDIELAEDMPGTPGGQAPEVAEPTIPTIELLDMDVAHSETETHAALHDADVNTSLSSFELSVDDSPFATRDNVLPGSATSNQPVPSIADESPLEEEDFLGSFELPPDLPALADEETLQDLPMPTLDDPDFTSLPDLMSIDDALPTLPSPEATAAEATPEGTLTSSDMLALENLEESTLPEYVTLEMNAPELPDDLISSLFEEAESTSLQDDPAHAGATTDAGPEPDFTTSDALALGELDETTLPGHLTLELDTSDLIPDVSSTTMDSLQLDNPPADVQSKTPPPPQPADNEEELLLDLDDFEFDDDKSK